jgi:iron(III) transport system permease protein
MAGWGIVAWPSAEENTLWQHLASTLLLDLLGNTLKLLLGVLIATTFLGVSLAWLVSIYHFPGRKLLAWGLMLPLAIPPYILAFVAIGLLDFSGPVQTALRLWSGGASGSFPQIRSTGGVICVMTLALYPYVYLPARQAFCAHNDRRLALSQLFGHRLGFWHVALPMAKPAITAGVSLVIMETVSDFGAVSIFNYDTMTTAVYKAWFGFFSLPTAARLSLFLAMPVLSCLLIASIFRSGAQYTQTSGKATPRIALRGTARIFASLYAGGVFFVAVILPVGQLAVWAAQNFSADFDSRYIGYLTRSVALGGMAAFACGAMAFGLVLFRRGRPERDWTAAIATLGYALPGPVLAVGLFIAFAALDKQIGFLTLNGTLFTLLCGYVIRFQAVAAAPIDSAMARIPITMDETARSLGCNGIGLLSRLYLPALRGGGMTAVVMVFLDVMKEMPMTLMSRPFGWETLSVRIFEMTAEGQWERAALPALTLVATSSLLTMLFAQTEWGK